MSETQNETLADQNTFILSWFLFFCFCDFTTQSNPTPAGMTRSGSFSILGNRLITISPPDTETYCEDSTTPIVAIDSSEADTSTFEIQGNTLTSFGYLETLASGAVVQIKAQLQRVGNGSGIFGGWTFSKILYASVTGQPTSAEAAELDSEVTLEEPFYFYDGLTITYAGNSTYTIYLNPMSAEIFLAEWNGTFAVSLYTNSGLSEGANQNNIKVAVQDRYTVKMQGLTTGETVYVTDSADGNVVYTSSDSSHSTSYFYEKPVSCPDPYEPGWYDAFLAANAMSGEIPEAKIGERPKTLRQYSLLWGGRFNL